jgi:hypothetical protein
VTDQLDPLGQPEEPTDLDDPLRERRFYIRI